MREDEMPKCNHSASEILQSPSRCLQLQYRQVLCLLCRCRLDGRALHYVILDEGLLHIQPATDPVSLARQKETSFAEALGRNDIRDAMQQGQSCHAWASESLGLRNLQLVVVAS